MGACVVCLGGAGSEGPRHIAWASKALQQGRSDPACSAQAHTPSPRRCPAAQRKGGRACCGVTTGQLFCAMVGSQRRSEYTVFGNAINLRWGRGRGTGWWCSAGWCRAGLGGEGSVVCCSGKGSCRCLVCIAWKPFGPVANSTLVRAAWSGPCSARLMVRARDRGAEVYCDATTQQLAKHKASAAHCSGALLCLLICGRAAVGSIAWLRCAQARLPRLPYPCRCLKRCLSSACH